MPSAVGQREPLPATGLRCRRCGVEVESTCHTRTGYVVGYYVLHTGPTEEASVRRRDDEAPVTYRRLLEVVEVVSCPRCLASPDMRRLWETFGDAELARS
jgi:hypothetical protein